MRKSWRRRNNNKNATPLGSSLFLSNMFNSNPGKITEPFIPIVNAVSSCGLFFFKLVSLFSCGLLACIYIIIVANVGTWHFNNILLHFKENTPFCTVLCLSVESLFGADVHFCYERASECWIQMEPGGERQLCHMVSVPSYNTNRTSVFIIFNIFGFNYSHVYFRALVMESQN